MRSRHCTHMCIYTIKLHHVLILYPIIAQIYLRYLTKSYCVDILSQEHLKLLTVWTTFIVNVIQLSLNIVERKMQCMLYSYNIISICNTLCGYMYYNIGQSQWEIFLFNIWLILSVTEKSFLNTAFRTCRQFCINLYEKLVSEWILE